MDLSCSKCCANVREIAPLVLWTNPNYCGVLKNPWNWKWQHTVFDNYFLSSFCINGTISLSPDILASWVTCYSLFDTLFYFLPQKNCYCTAVIFKALLLLSGSVSYPRTLTCGWERQDQISDPTVRGWLVYQLTHNCPFVLEDNFSFMTYSIPFFFFKT